MNKSQLLEQMAELGPTDGRPPERHTWDRHRYELRRHCKKGDDLGKFLQWSTLTETMFVGEAPYIADEFSMLRDSGEWERWRKAIEETEFGGAPRLSYAEYTSGNLVHQAYHVFMWENALGLRAENLNRIVEFGGGYGAMALIMRRLGFSGEYFIFDVPEVSLLQGWYLSATGVENVAMCPCKDTEQYEPPRYVDLVVGCWSLSEAPVKTRELFLDAVEPYSYLIAYQPQWKDTDNVAWFDKFTDEHNEYHWSLTDACRGSRYLFGKMRGGAYLTYSDYEDGNGA